VPGRIIKNVDFWAIILYYIGMDTAQIEVKTEAKQIGYVPSKHISHQLYMQQLTTEIQSGHISIWALGFFPYATRPIRITPEQYKAAIDEYAITAKPISDILSAKGIDYGIFWELMDRYAEIAEYYQQASTRKAKEYYYEAQQVYTTDSPPDAAKDISTSAGGATSERWSTAYVQYMRNRADFKMRQAIIHDRATYGDKQQVEVTSTTRSINANISVTTDTQGMIDLFTSGK
jgi:hypothetical protein